MSDFLFSTYPSQELPTVQIIEGFDEEIILVVNQLDSAKFMHAI